MRKLDDFEPLRTNLDLGGGGCSKNLGGALHLGGVKLMLGGAHPPPRKSANAIFSQLLSETVMINEQLFGNLFH